ncbi:MAG: alkaline phosphatase family protein [Planctomycetia bacterium]|nr:alkaline phosphatase family protein [Planctomycetia bacterium]
MALAGSFMAVFAAVFSAVILLLTWPVRMGFRAAFGRKPPAQAKVDRVVILGLDGLDYGLTEKLLAEGKLPHLARLRDQGGFQALGSTLPPITPVAWSTFQTGVNPGKHNIFDFLVPDEQTYRPKLSSVEMRAPRRVLRLGGMKFPLGKADFRLLRKSRTFWSILGDYGIFNCIIRVPITFPPEKLRGVQLSAMCVPDLRGTQGVFSRYTTNPTYETTNTVGETVVVVRQGASIRAELVGPLHPRHAERGPLKLPFIVTIKDRDHAVLRIHGTTRTLRRGEYSDWIRISFAGGWGVRIAGVCKFLWVAAEPHFELYVTPLNIDPEKPAMRIGYPAVYPIYLAKRQGAYATLGLAEDTWGLNEHVLDDDSFLQQCLDTDRERESMFFDALDKVPRGLCVCVFDASDRLQHMFWRYHDEQHPNHPPNGLPRHRHAIDDLYQRMDQLVGRTMAKCNRDGTVLMVLSDHGFNTFRTGVDLNRWLEQNGYLKVDDARRNEEYLAGVDWSQTRAFALGLTGIFLSLRVRFSQGIVDSGSEAEQLRDEIVQRLGNLTEPGNGSNAIKKVYQATQVYRGPYKNQAPDLIVGYERGYRVSWESAAGRTTRDVFHANTKAWSGDHCVDPSLVPGVLFCNRPLLTENPRLLDIAPTVLGLFGIAAPEHMDGKALVLGDRATAASDAPPLPVNQVT